MRRVGGVVFRIATKKFSDHKRHAVKVSDRGRIIGTWTPSSSEPEVVDFASRAASDSGGKKLPFTFSQMLKEKKKR